MGPRGRVVQRVRGGGRAASTHGHRWSQEKMEVGRGKQRQGQAVVTEARRPWPVLINGRELRWLQEEAVGGAGGDGQLRAWAGPAPT